MVREETKRAGEGAGRATESIVFFSRDRSRKRADPLAS